MKPHSAFVQSKQKIMFSIFCGKCELCLNKARCKVAIVCCVVAEMLFCSC